MMAAGGQNVISFSLYMTYVGPVSGASNSHSLRLDHIGSGPVAAEGIAIGFELPTHYFLPIAFTVAVTQRSRLSSRLLL